jgi:hypothetical protein
VAILLPFSEEAIHLEVDIELVEFLARAALVAGSKTFKV